MPAWLIITLKGIITVATFGLLGLLFDTVKRYKTSIIPNRTLLALYITMVCALCADCISVWMYPVLHEQRWTIPFINEV